MKAILCALLLISTLHGLSQDDQIYRFNEDVNGDGNKDSIYVTKTTGIGSFFCRVDFLLAGKRKITVTTDCNAGAFICILPLPDEISNVQFIRKLSDSVFHVTYSDSLPADVRWMAQVTSNGHFLQKAREIDYASKFTPVSMYSSSYITPAGVSAIADKSFIKTLKNYGSRPAPAAMELKQKRYLLIYYADNHKELKCYSESANIGLCTTNHGVYISNGCKKASVFINDLNIFGSGSEKLRWPSIKNAQRDSNYVLIQTYSTVSEVENVYIVNVADGDIIRLNNDYFHADSYPVLRLENGKLYLQKSTLNLPQLFSRYGK
jgi:hypothetical protein